MTKQQFDEREYIDGTEAARVLGVKKETLYAYVSRGVLQSFKQGVGRGRVYRRADIEALRAVRPAATAEETVVPVVPDAPADGGVVRDVYLPDAETWAGDH